MQTIAIIALDNELDLILAHKRTMKLAELAGFSLSSQTTFATAVSEVARVAIEHGKGASLAIGADRVSGAPWCLFASITDHAAYITDPQTEAVRHARKLVDNLHVRLTDQGTEMTIRYKLPASHPINAAIINQWKNAFGEEPPLSPYDEIKRKNLQLQEMSDRLRVSESQYRTLTESLPLMIFSFDPKGDLLYANRWLRDYTGKSLTVLNETKWKGIIHKEDFANFWENWEQHSLDGTPFRTEIRLGNAETGNYLWHLAALNPLADTTNTIWHWTGFLVDINAQKLIEQTLHDNAELKEARHQLEQYQWQLEQTIQDLHRSNDELMRFAYVASHDLQEPLRKVQTFGDVLMNQYATALDENGIDMIRRMQSAARRMQNLIQDLLTYSRLTPKQNDFRAVDLNQLIKSVLDDLEMMPRFNEAHVQIATLPIIKGHPAQLGQLFQNLIANAIKFSQPGNPPEVVIQSRRVNLPELSPNTHADQSTGDWIAIDVTDNGIGFDEQYRERIFQLFQRLHGTNQYAGTGMGLAICKKVTELHGGTISARSKPGHGATFTAYFPASVLQSR